jgi:hypothetical protein
MELANDEGGIDITPFYNLAVKTGKSRSSQGCLAITFIPAKMMQKRLEFSKFDTKGKGTLSQEVVWF